MNMQKVFSPNKPVI